MLGRLFTLLVLAALLAVPLNSAAAQTALPGLSTGSSNTPQADTTPEGAIAGLSDAEVRQRLLQRLQDDAALEAAEQQEATTAAFTQQLITGLYSPVFEAVERVPLMITAQIGAFRTFGETLGMEGMLRLLFVFVISVVAGLIAERGFNMFMRRQYGESYLKMMSSQPETLSGRLKFLLLRLFNEAAGVLVFFIVARIVGQQFVTPEILPYVLLITLYLVVIPRWGWAFSRFLLAPERSEYRLVHTDDWTANFMHRSNIGLVLLIGATMGILEFNELNGLESGQTRLGFWLNASVHLYIIYIIWRTRTGLVMMMRGADPNTTPMEERVAQFYPYFGILVAVGVWLLINVIVSFRRFDLLQDAPHYWTMALLLLAPALDTMIRGLVNATVPPMQGTGALAEQAYIASKRSFIRIGRTIVFACVVLAIAAFWGLNLDVLAADGLGAQFAAALIEALLTLAVGYLVWELVSLWINRKLAAEQTVSGSEHEAEAASEGEGGQGGSRLSTVLPLGLLAARVAIAAIVGLIALSALGIDTTPLLAGAGVVGLAVGFGAQKLVGDVVSGIFFLIDDAFRVGEYVEVDGTMGTVEKISIRSMQLRHHLGPVHTIPYGEIPKLTNYSRDWVIMKLKFTVPFETDPNQVKKIFKRIGQEMAVDETFKNDFLQPFKSQGVLDFDDRGMIVRGKFMARPGTQFTIRKELFNRIKKAFNEAGIEFARREVQVAIPGLEQATQLSEEQKKAVGAAAAEAAQQAVETDAGAASPAGADSRG